MNRSIMMIHATLFWLIFLLLSVSNSFLRESVYEPLAGELWSHIFATSSLVLFNLLLIYYFFVQKRSYKKQALIKEKRERASSSTTNPESSSSGITGGVGVAGLTSLSLTSLSNTTRKLFSFERKRNMLLIGVWWLLLTIVFELIIGWIRGVDGLSESVDYSWLSYVSVMRWAKSHVVVLIVCVQLLFPILIGTLVMRMDEKAEIVDRDLSELQQQQEQKKNL